MENKKLKLEELRIQSFVTEFEKGNGNTMEVQGGNGILPTDQSLCIPTRNKACWTLRDCVPTPL